MCFGDPQCQISSLPLSSGRSRAVPPSDTEQSPGCSSSFSFSCFPPLGQASMPTSYISTLQPHPHLWRRAWGTLCTQLPPGVRVQPQFYLAQTHPTGRHPLPLPTHGALCMAPALPPLPAPFPCTCGMSELTHAKTQCWLLFPMYL